MKKATANDKQLVVNILTKAFHDNKSVNFVAKQDSRRVERIRKLMGYSFQVCMAFGEVWITSDNNACALILFSDQKKVTIQSIIWDATLAINVIGIDRISKVLKRESNIKQHHPKEPFAYLWFIGVNPDQQGNRIGTSLLLDVIKECDKRNKPIYLETSVDKNILWYNKLGFEIFHTLNLSYNLYLLRRKKNLFL